MLTFGGGYAMIPLFQDEIVSRHAFMAAEEFANLVALAQVTPGPIGFNAATYVGMTNGGVAGAMMASLGVAVPSVTLTLIVAACLAHAKDATWLKTMMKTIRPCVVGIIAAAVIFFADTSVFTAPFANLMEGKDFGICWQGAAIFAAVIVVRLKWKKLNPIWALAGSAALGWVLL